MFSPFCPRFPDRANPTKRQFHRPVIVVLRSVKSTTDVGRGRRLRSVRVSRRQYDGRNATPPPPSALSFSVKPSFSARFETVFGQRVVVRARKISWTSAKFATETYALFSIATERFRATGGGTRTIRLFDCVQVDGTRREREPSALFSRPNEKWPS